MKWVLFQSLNQRHQLTPLLGTLQLKDQLVQMQLGQLSICNRLCNHLWDWICLVMMPPLPLLLPLIPLRVDQLKLDLLR